MTRLKKVKRNTLLRAKNESKDSPLLNAFVRQAGCLCFVYAVQKLSVKRKERREFCKTRSEFKGAVEAVRKEPDDRSVADRHHKRAPVQADQFPKKAEGHDRTCKQVREINAGLEARQPDVVAVGNGFYKEVVNLRVEIGFEKQRNRK